MTGAREGSRSLLIVALLLATVALSGPAPAEAKRGKGASGGSTKVAAAMPAALAELYPGLCMPVDTPLCTNAAQDQVHIYSQSCGAAGTFEGRRLRSGSPCEIDLTAFMDPSAGFAKPNCVTTHTYTSDEATAFGRPVNAVTIRGLSRKIQLGYPFALASSRTAWGWVDGPDRDRDPVGDHRLVFSILVRPHQGSPPVCITEPITGGDVTAVLHIYDLP